MREGGTLLCSYVSSPRKENQNYIDFYFDVACEWSVSWIKAYLHQKVSPYPELLLWADLCPSQNAYIEALTPMWLYWR